MKIYKYWLNVTDVQTIQMPEGKILSVQNQNGLITLWVLIDEQNPDISRTFKIYGTGHKIESPMLDTYIDTVQLNGYVWHIFEDKLA